MTAEVTALPGGRSKYEIKDVRLPDATIAHCLANNKDGPINAVTDKAKTHFGEVNEQTRTETETRLNQLKANQSDEKNVQERIQEKRKDTTGALYAKTPSKYDPQYRMSLSERGLSGLYTILRFITLGVSVTAIALYARSSGFSVDVSSSWIIAILYGFPALILSGVIANRIDYTDNLKEKRAIARRLIYIAMAFFLLWVGATAIMFAPEEATNSGYQVNFASPVQAVQSAVDIVDWLFPKSIFGLVLLFAHVLTDIFAAAALATHAKLQGLKGRTTQFDELQETAAHRQHYDLHSERLIETNSEIKVLEGVLAAFLAKESACVSAAKNRMHSMMLEQQSRHLQVTLDVIYGTAKITPAPIRA